MNRYYHFVSRAFDNIGIITIAAPNLGEALLIMERNLPAFAGAFNCLGEIMWIAAQSPNDCSKPIFARLLPGWSDHAAYEIRA